MTTGEKLKAIRKKLGLSQRELSNKLKISRGYIAEMEIGIKTPSGKIRRKINSLYRKCFGVKKEPFVEVMTPEKPKQNWFVRLIKWVME